MTDMKTMDFAINKYKPWYMSFQTTHSSTDIAS